MSRKKSKKLKSYTPPVILTEKDVLLDKIKTVYPELNADEILSDLEKFTIGEYEDSWGFSGYR